MGVVSWRELDRYIIDSYCEAAKAGAEMRAASTAIETIRDAVNAIPAGGSIMEAWGTIDRQIGLADLDRLVPVLVNLRSEFQKIAIEREIFRLQRAFEHGKESGWTKWVETYARALSPWGWRTELGLEIARHALRNYSPADDWPVRRIREAAELVEKSRWSETYDWFIFLSEQDIHPELRSHMLVTAAEIQLYHFYQPSKAKVLLDQAAEMAPDSWRVQVGWGEYWMQREKLEPARECFERVIQEMHDLADGYVNMGDYYDQLGELSHAEDLYQQAVSNAPGALDGYRRLINFYGNSTRFTEREDRLDPLFQRTLALDEDRSYAYISIGLIYKENQRFDQALGYFERAIQEDKNSVLARVWQGYTHMDQVSDPHQDSQYIEKARSSFEKVIEIAPGTIDGYWGIMRLEMQLENWEAALQACNRCFNIHPEWESFVLVGRADIYRQLGRLEEAEEDLLRSLEIEPDNPGALSVLSSLAESYKSTDDKELTLRALETLRRYKDDSYEQTYQNLIGNMHYYFSEYAEAAQRYRQAVAAKPDDDVLHSNLALALERQNTPDNRLVELDEAIQHLGIAIGLNPQDAEYPARLRSLETEYRFIQVYGEAARGFTPVVPGIRIRVSDNLLPDILSENQEDLSEETRLAIEKVRQHVLDTLGIELPGILFSYLDSAYSQDGKYELYFQEQYQDFGYAEPGMLFAGITDESAEVNFPFSSLYGHWINDRNEIEESERDRFSGFYSVTEYILSHLAKAVGDNPAELLGIQDMLNLLNKCTQETVDEIKASPQEMLRYALVLRRLLEKHIALKDIQSISTQYLSVRNDAEDVEDIANQLASMITV